MRRPLAHLFAVAFGGAVLVACTKEADVTGTYAISFQSTAEAIAATDVRVFVFDASTLPAPEPCLDLLYLRESGQTLPASILEIGPTTTCAIAQGAGQMSVPFGEVAVLVVAETSAGDFARGCSVHTFSSGDPSVTVPLVLTEGQAVPATSCTSLSLHCAGKC